MPVYSALLGIPLAAHTGYGNDGFALARAFSEAGLDVHLKPEAVNPPLPMPVAQLLTKTPPDTIDLLVHHVSPSELGLDRSYPGVKKVAWSMWEFKEFPAEIAHDLAARLSTYDMIFVYDAVSYEAFEPYVEDAGIPMKILQGGVWADDWQYDNRNRDWGKEKFRFVMAGALHRRKGVWEAIEAFKKVHEQRPDTELFLKTGIRSLHPAIAEQNPGIEIFYDSWSHAQMRSFYASAHCYLAPSWGEGKNLPALESGIMGIPSIYSAVGGHLQWGDSTIGFPVSGDWGYADGMTSFRVDPDELVEKMLFAVDNREEVRRRGEMAARVIPSMCDWSKVTQRFLNQVF